MHVCLFGDKITYWAHNADLRGASCAYSKHKPSIKLLVAVWGAQQAPQQQYDLNPNPLGGCMRCGSTAFAATATSLITPAVIHFNPVFMEIVRKLFVCLSWLCMVTASVSEQCQHHSCTLRHTAASLCTAAQPCFQNPHAKVTQALDKTVLYHQCRAGPTYETTISTAGVDNTAGAPDKHARAFKVVQLQQLHIDVAQE